MDPTEEGCFSISAQSDLSKLLKRSKLLVVDEATLIDRRNFDKLEATLRDITGSTLPWGGKIAIFCGDFRSSNSKHCRISGHFLKFQFLLFSQAMPSHHRASQPCHHCCAHHHQISPLERCPSEATEQEHACVGQLRRQQAGRV